MAVFDVFEGLQNGGKKDKWFSYGAIDGLTAPNLTELSQSKLTDT